jgi:hypothetical protein
MLVVLSGFYEDANAFATGPAILKSTFSVWNMTCRIFEKLSKMPPRPDRPSDPREP